MRLHRGRLIDHVHLRVRHLDRARQFYSAVFEVLGVPLTVTDRHLSADELWIDEGSPLSHVHLAFQVPDRATVDRFHVAALQAGGLDNGAPAERKYHPGYYAAFVYDPDGNNVEAVYHGPARRSAASVVVESP